MFEYVVYYNSGRHIAYAKTEEEAAYIVAKFGGYTICNWRAFNKEGYEKKFGTGWDRIRERVTNGEVWDIMAEGHLYTLPPF